MIHIIGGLWRGIPLATPMGGTRPTHARSREAVMNILRDRLPGAHVLDLFAGSGAMGLEALSRGAASALLIDKAPDAIRANIAKCRTQNAQLIRGDALKTLQTTTAQFDLCFVDPPYADTALLGDCLNALLPRLTPAAMVVVESDRAIDAPPGYVATDTRRYGANHFTFMRPKEEPPCAS